MTVRVLDEVPDPGDGREQWLASAPAGAMGAASADLLERAANPDRRWPVVMAAGRPGASTRTTFLSGLSFQDGAEIAGAIRDAGGELRSRHALALGLPRRGTIQIATKELFGGRRPMDVACAIEGWAPARDEGR